MQKNTLREISKFLAGLVAGDFLAAWWLYATGMAPVSVFGFKFSNQDLILGIMFDVFLFVFLVHYGWGIKNSGHSSKERTFHRVIGTIFGIIALGHLFRLIFNLPVNILSWEVPYWISGVGAVVAAFLSYTSFRLTSKD